MIGPILGAICLGIVMGWLMRYSLDRFRQYTPKVFGSVVSVVAGGVLVAIFQGSDPVGHYARWFYFVGLLLGLVLYPYISQPRNSKLDR